MFETLYCLKLNSTIVFDNTGIFTITVIIYKLMRNAFKLKFRLLSLNVTK